MASIENELPRHTDAAHHDPPTTGLRLSGDAAREIAALKHQVLQCEDHNTELLLLLQRVRATCEAGQTAARNRIAQGGDAALWQARDAVYAELYALVKPVS